MDSSIAERLNCLKPFLAFAVFGSKKSIQFHQINAHTHTHRVHIREDKEDYEEEKREKNKVIDYDFRADAVLELVVVWIGEVLGGVTVCRRRILSSSLWWS